jgi:group I intron endonuclease
MAWVYRIVRKKTGICYVGHTSESPGKRWAGHLALLTAGKHHSRYLQNAWNKYGADVFKFEVIEECSEADKLKREQHWMDGLNSRFNTAKVAGSRKGVKFTRIQRELLSKLRMGHFTSEVTKRKISLAHMGKEHEPHTDKAKRKIGRAARRWWKQNDQTPAQRESTLKSLELGRAKSRANKPGWIPTHRIGVKDTARTIKKRIASKLAFHEEQRAAGIRNWWITDGESEQMILSFEPIPQGWRRGRQPKIGEIGRSRVGEKRSDAARKNMSKAHKGVALSEAHRAAQKRGWIERRQEN